jgi:hypothetical protein
MKNLILFLLVWIVQSSQAQQVWKTVGKIEGNQLVLSQDKANLLKAFNENFPSVSGMQETFTDVAIVSVGEEQYSLVFQGEGHKASFYLRRVGNSGVLEAFTKTSCFTFDCSGEVGGCLVVYNGGDVGFCSPCGNGGKCAKITSSTSLF